MKNEDVKCFWVFGFFFQEDFIASLLHVIVVTEMQREGDLPALDLPSPSC
jgi:hypothetical protein